MSSRRRYELGVGLLLVAALSVLAFMALQVGALGGLGRSVQVTARFADAVGLSEGAVVAIAGVEIGTVERMRVEHDRAVVEMAIDPAAQVRSDARVMIRARSVLGEKYVEVLPQSRDAEIATTGAELVAVTEQTEIDELVNLLGPLLRAVDPETLHRTGELLSRSLEEDPARLARMLENADRLLANTASASDELPGLVREGRQAVSEGRRVLSRADRAVAAVEARATEAGPLIERADRAMAHVEASTAPLPELMIEIEGAVGDAREALAVVDADLAADLRAVLSNMRDLDKTELRRLLREEGILVRLRPREIEAE